MASPTRRARVYARGSRLWIDYTDEQGRRQRQSTGLAVGQEAAAERVLAAVLRQIREGGPEAGTVAAWAEEWIKGRKERGIASATEDESRLKHHIIPAFGAMPLADVRLRDVRRWVARLERTKSERTGKPLAPRTVRLIYGTMRTMMADAVGDELIPISPCQLRPKHLPRKTDKDPTWRPKALYSREEIGILISHPDIPEDRRVAYALLALGGLRWGELAALRWSAYDPEVKPLGRLTIASAYNSKRKTTGTTKTEVVRPVPVHPQLAAVLGRWRLSTRGQPDDLIVPPTGRSKAAHRSGAQGLRQLRADLEMLGWRPRRLHDLRRAFISHAQDDGAPQEVVRQITHTPPSTDIMELYTTRGWATLCRAVSGLDIGPPGPADVPVQAVAGAQSGAQPGGGTKKAPQDQHLTGQKLAGDVGLEPTPRRLSLISGGGKTPVKSGAYVAPTEPESRSTQANPGHSCALCAPGDPEARIRAAIEGATPAEARALLLRILSELG